MALRETVASQRVQNVLRQTQEPELVCDRRLRFAESAGRLLLTHAEHSDELAYAVRFLDEVEIPPLQIFDERKQARFLKPHVKQYARDLAKPRKLCRPQSAFACDKLVSAVAQSHGERVQYAVLGDAARQLHKVGVPENLSRLHRIGADVVDGDAQNAAVTNAHSPLYSLHKNPSVSLVHFVATLRNIHYILCKTCLIIAHFKFLHRR